VAGPVAVAPLHGATSRGAGTGRDDDGGTGRVAGPSERALLRGRAQASRAGVPAGIPSASAAGTGSSAGVVSRSCSWSWMNTLRLSR
jgi:hypothetical protein